MSDPIDDLARRLFEAAREESPDAELIARVRGRSAGVPARLPDTRGNSASGARIVELCPTRGVCRWRWLAVAALLGGVLLSGFWRSGEPGDVSISAEARAPRPSPAPVGAPPPEAAPVKAPAVAPEPAPPAARPPMRRESSSRSAAPTAPAIPAARAIAAPAAAPTEVAAPTEATPAPLSAQLELLKRARSLLRAGDGAGALQAIDRYGSELHGTDLQDEAELLRIEALWSLGRRPEASARARRFVADHPDSPLAERAQRFSVEPGAVPAPASTP